MVLTEGGHGSGTCNVTNSGTLPGSFCGRVTIRHKEHEERYVQSAVFCHDSLNGGMTYGLRFQVPFVEAICGPGTLDVWRRDCALEFREEP